MFWLCTIDLLMTSSIEDFYNIASFALWRKQMIEVVMLQLCLEL
jgi:hypothetical protein